MTIATLISGTAALLFSAWTFTACLRLRSATEFLLAAYLIAFGEVVALSLILSPAHWLTRTNLFIAVYLTWLAALLVWRACGLPRPPSFRPTLGALRQSLRDPVLALLAVALAGAVGYLTALIVFTAPNDYDALWYHLSRAAFWKQQHAVAYISGVNNPRLNAFPPNAEIADAFTVILGRTERFVGFAQLAALAATMVGIAGIARRLGLGRRQALFGALVFATLPVVALQASTALNDLVLGSFLVCATYFVLSPTRTSLALTALAVGLALGTKVTTFVALPVLAVAAALVHPRSRWPAVALAGAAGIALGSVWYLVNLAETGRLDGNLGHSPDARLATARHGGEAARFLAHGMKLAIDSVDPSGSVGRDRFVYAAAAAAVLALVAWLAWRRRSRPLLVLAGVAGALALLPLAVGPVHDELVRGYQKLWVELGYDRLAFLGFDKHSRQPSSFQSWYGPVGLLLVLVTVPLAVHEARRRTLPWVGALFAVTPIVWIVILVFATAYSLWDGRYLILAVALAAVTWGLVLYIRPVAWAAAAAATATLVLALVHYGEKPSGVNVLGGAAARSVWDRERWEVLSRWLEPGESSALRTIERRAGPGSVVALRIRPEDVSYPWFGGRLDRHVVFADRGRSPGGADWLIVAPGKARPTVGWERVPTGGYGWRVYRRTAAA